MKTVAPTLLFALVTGLMSTGCEWVALGIALSDDDCESDCCGDECWDDPPEAPPPDPPTIDFTIADWPPMGSASTLSISAQADNGLGNTTFFFRNTVLRSFNGETSATLSVTGAELGEGFGRLEVDVASWDGSISRRGVDGLLVDLTAPTAYVDDLNVVRAVGDHFSFYMADAWIVSGCELTVGDQIFTEQLDPGFPPTLGVDWDFSLVSIPSEDLPIGTHSASLRVWDAAGNESILPVAITIDGLPPDVGITSPVEDATLEGYFDLQVTASDDVPLPVAIEIHVGGALVATGTSPSTTITLSTEDFPAGPTEISATAVDEAGNRSAPLVRNVVFVAAE
ncbi:MAG: hypothetical protein IPM79_01300 [Polyangiaceae bacterium]|nr:hypothetical protein [Polyangiaceae bacterium]MBK8936307.1 hypothetical protein [Polyangiaceae bacterium]